MRNEFDLAGYAANQQLVLVGEVKFLKETSPENAAFFRRNLLSHGLLSPGPYFLLAYRTTMFLWKGTTDIEAKPDFVASMKPVLKRYLKLPNAEADAAGPETLEYATNSWLSDVAAGIQTPDPRSEPDRLLVDSGLYASLKGGEIRRHVSG